MKLTRRMIVQQGLSGLSLAALPRSGQSRTKAFYNPNIQFFYRPEMVLQEDAASNYSKSPLKPRLFLRFLQRKQLFPYFSLVSDWHPFNRDDFFIAHQRHYVDAFFAGSEPLASSNGLMWSPQFADSVRYTNASLYHALLAAVTDSATVAYSPSSGFHHAMPTRGSGFCTFSGQVIASTKIYRQFGLAGVHIDLDGHFGNSIEDSRRFVKDLDKAIPPGCNVNPRGKHALYLADLRRQLAEVGKLFLQEKVHYVVYAHGADSHEWDNLGGQCTTEEWMEAARLVYTWIRMLAQTLGRPVPLTLALFGGYRKDNYDAVLSLHAADVALGLSILCQQPVYYRPEVTAPRR